jgi:hypothetical protein
LGNPSRDDALIENNHRLLDGGDTFGGLGGDLAYFSSLGKQILLCKIIHIQRYMHNQEPHHFVYLRSAPRKGYLFHDFLGVQTPSNASALPEVTAYS